MAQLLETKRSLCGLCTIDLPSDDMRRLKTVAIQDCEIHNQKGPSIAKMSDSDLRVYMESSKLALEEDKGLSLGEIVGISYDLVLMQYELDRRLFAK